MIYLLFILLSIDYTALNAKNNNWKCNYYVKKIAYNMQIQSKFYCREALMKENNYEDSLVSLELEGVSTFVHQVLTVKFCLLLRIIPESEVQL